MFHSRPLVYVFCCKVLFSAIWITGFFFPSQESFMVQYSICAPLSVTADGCADTVFQQCVCVPLYTAAECRRTGLVLNTCPARLAGFSPAEEIKRRWDKKLPRGSRLQLKQPHRNSKYHYFPRASIPPPPLCSFFPFYSLQNTRKMHTPCARRASPSGLGGTFALVSPPFLCEKWWCWFLVVTSMSFDCSRFA